MTQIVDSPKDWVAQHIQRYVRTGGQDGHEWRPGVRTLLLTTTGRKSGVGRRTALIYGRDGEDYVVVASQGGAPTHPNWYLNLTANSAVGVQVGPETFEAEARVATGERRDRLWASMARIWPDYDSYAAKTDREIPVVVLRRLG